MDICNSWRNVITILILKKIQLNTRLWPSQTRLWQFVMAYAPEEALEGRGSFSNTELPQRETQIKRLPSPMLDGGGEKGFKVVTHPVISQNIYSRLEVYSFTVVWQNTGH